MVKYRVREVVTDYDWQLHEALNNGMENLRMEAIDDGTEIQVINIVPVSKNRIMILYSEKWG
jgi:hypothetical protein